MAPKARRHNCSFDQHELYKTERFWTSGCWECGKPLCNSWYVCDRPGCSVDICAQCAAEQESDYWREAKEKDAKYDDAKVPRWL